MHLDPTKSSAVDEPQATIRVALVDDHAAVRAGLVAILGDEPRINVDPLALIFSAFVDDALAVMAVGRRCRRRPEPSSAGQLNETVTAMAAGAT
jgi:hypothetical protein